MHVISHVSHLRVNSSGSSALLIVILPQESGLMSVHSTMGFEYKIDVPGHTSIVLY